MERGDERLSARKGSQSTQGLALQESRATYSIYWRHKSVHADKLRDMVFGK